MHVDDSSPVLTWFNKGNELRRAVTARLVLVFATIALTLSAAWIWGAQHNHVPCISDCGETFIAQLYARNWRFFGLDFGLVEDHATSPRSEAHPYYYTHNVNIGGLYFVLLDVLGVDSFAAKQFFVLLIFGLGLFYAYAAVAVHTKSRIAGYCVLVAACLDFGFFFSFGLHALRVWTWVALFGLSLHVGRFAQSERASKVGDSIAIVVFSSIAFGIGYEFWVTSMCIAVATHYFFNQEPVASRLYAKRVGLLLLLFFIPFVLRQLHIAAILGAEYWSRDFYYTFAAKIPFAGLILDVPEPQAVEEFYRSHNVLRPPTASIQSANEFANSLLALIVGLVYGTLPQAGLLTMAIAALMCLTAIALVAGAKAGRISNQDGEKNRSYARGDIDNLGAARLIAGLSVGIGLGYLIMPRMVVPFYVALGMPLLGAVVAVAKGIFVATLISAIRASFMRQAARAWAFAILAFVLVDHGLVQAANVRAAKPMDTSWVDSVSARPDATYAVSFIAPVVAGFTSNWVVGIRTGREWEMLEAVVNGRAPFQKGDLFWFGERDAEQRDWQYLRPDYWLYFPIDKRTPFLAVEPECRQDYLSAFISAFISNVAFARGAIVSLTDLPGKAPPASKITVELKLNRVIQAQGVSLSLDGKTFTPASFNCISNRAVGQLVLPPHETTREVIATVSFKYGMERVSINLGKVYVSSTADRAPNADVPKAQPSIREILDRFPTLPIERLRVTKNPWEGFLLIDLRGLYPNRRSTAQADSRP